VCKGRNLEVRENLGVFMREHGETAVEFLSLVEQEGFLSFGDFTNKPWRANGMQ
jgi:hypothetical protein